MKKQTCSLQAIAALCLALALPAALAWYYDVYVNWRPNVYPLVMAVLFAGTLALTLLTLRVRGERKSVPLVWKTALSVIVFMAVLFGISGVINNSIYEGIHPGPTIAAAVSLPLCAAQWLALFALLLQKLRKPAVAVCLVASCLLSSFFLIGTPWYMKERYRAPIPALPEGRFAPMPELGEVDLRGAG